MNCFAHTRYWPYQPAETPYMDWVLIPIIWNGEYVGAVWKRDENLTLKLLASEGEGWMN